MWFQLKGDERITHRCASEDCGGQPTWKLEAGGVGAFYCSGCKEKIDAASTEKYGHAEPFGRQPKPVKIVFEGEPMDIAYWKQRLMRAAEFKGDMTQSQGLDTFKIYPRAVND